MDKKIIVVAGAIVVVGGGFIAHSMAGKAAEQQIQQSIEAIEKDPRIDVSDVDIRKGWGKTSLIAQLDVVDVPGVGGELAMDVGYLSREAEGTMTFNGEALEGVVHFTTELDSERYDYRFNTDELGAHGGTLTLERIEGEGYVDNQHRHFALNMRIPKVRVEDASGNLEISDFATELEHNISAEAGKGRSHARFAMGEGRVIVDNGDGPMEAISLGEAETRSTATLDGDTLSSRFYFAATDAVVMDSEPGHAELDITAESLDYAVFDAVADVLERHLEDADGQQVLTPEQQQALSRDIRQTLWQQVHTLLAHSPVLNLNTLDIDTELPMLGRANVELSGRLAFDGDDLPREATQALLAKLDAETHRIDQAKQGRPSMSLDAVQAELAPRVSAELNVAQLPDALVAELPPAFQALLEKDEAPHIFAWENGQPLYNGEPLAKALAQ